MEYEIVMGLEVHIELATNSKLFCACSTKFGAGQNENVCPACCGMPGMLPIVNKRAIELGITASILTNCEISKKVVFDKKNYFYPDLGTGYQLTQLDAPIGKHGRIDIETAQGKKRIRIKQIHIEEDAGKLVHDGYRDSSLVDYNRASIPLIEIVSEPDFRTADEVVAYLSKLQSILSYAGISDCKMQEGSMRCDVNISVRKKGSDILGVRTEIKNMNSFKAIVRAIHYESERHIDVIESKSGQLIQETRGWNDDEGFSFSMRSKENAYDYRYVPYPDSLEVTVSEEWIERLKREIPELPEEKLVRYREVLLLPPTDSSILVATKKLSEFFEQTLGYINEPKEISNWLIVDLLSYMKAEGIKIEDIALDCKKFAYLIELYKQNKINRVSGRKVFFALLKSNPDIDTYIKENGFLMESNLGDIKAAVTEEIQNNLSVAKEYADGNPKVIQFFIGKVMKRMQGKADPKIVSEIVADCISRL